MKKHETTGKLGEAYFEKLCVDNDIPLISNIYKEESHDYDYKLGSKAIEIKATMSPKNIIFLTRANLKAKIDYLIGISLPDKLFYVFDKKTVNKYKSAVPVNKFMKNYSLMNEEMLINFFNEFVDASIR